MIGFNGLERLIGAGVGLLTLGAIFGIALPAKSQTPACYMITQGGQLINLSSICGVQPTLTNPQTNPAARQQVNENIQTNPYGQPINGQGVANQQIPQQPIVQGAVAVPSGYGSTAQGANGFNSVWGPVTDSAEVRSEPSGGSLVQQIQGGETVRVYPGTQTNNSVLVETSNGQRGWMNIWNLPGASGVSP